MKIIFFGHDKTSIPFLKEISRNDTLLAIVLPSNRPKPQTEPLRKFAREQKIKLFQPRSPNENDFIGLIGSIKPDLAIVCNYSHIFQKKIIDIFPQGMINFHGGLLPQYRGANVLNWVLINGEKKTGMTVHYIDEKIDNGLIIKRGVVSINKKDNALSLQKLIIQKGLELLKQVLREARSNKIKVKSQSDYGHPKYYPRRHPKDGRINFNHNPEQIYNLVRALVEPWPGAYGYYDGKQIIFENISFVKTKHNHKHGEILRNNARGVAIAVNNGHILLKKIRKNEPGFKLKSFKPGEKFA